MLNHEYFGTYMNEELGIRAAYYVNENAKDANIFAARLAEPESKCSVIVVGEDNPYGANPDHALYPLPEGCSGHRLCHDIFGITQLTHLALWRTNLCAGKWSNIAARERAHDLMFYASRPWSHFILLGRKVAEAFTYVLRQSTPGVKIPAWTTKHFDERGRLDTTRQMSTDFTLIALPHPSGRNVIWNAEAVRANARMILARECPQIPWGEEL